MSKIRKDNSKKLYLILLRGLFLCIGILTFFVESEIDYIISINAMIFILGLFYMHKND